MATGAFFSVRLSGLAAANGKLQRTARAARPEMRREVSRLTILTHRDLLRNGLSGQKGSHPLFGITGAAGNTLGVRSGHTRRSIVHRVVELGATIIGIVGSPLRQMRLHEDGGTITGSPYLRIPTRHQQTGAGVDKLTGLSARGLPGGFLLRSRTGNLWIATREGGVLILRYLLKLSVRLRARHIFRDTLQRMRPAIVAGLRGAAARIVRA